MCPVRRERRRWVAETQVTVLIVATISIDMLDPHMLETVALMKYVE